VVRSKRMNCRRICSQGPNREQEWRSRVRKGGPSNCNKKGGLFSRLQWRGRDLNPRPLGYEFDNDLVRLCLSTV
jgi:hypothetical protein